MLLFKDTEEVFVADSGDKQNYSSFSTRQSPAGWLVPLLVWQAAPLAAAIIAGPVGTEQAYVLLTRNTEPCMSLIPMISKTIPVSSHIMNFKLAGLTVSIEGSSQELPRTAPTNFAPSNFENLSQAPMN